MKKLFILSLIILGSALSASSQGNYVYQPDSATIYFDTITNPQWYYGGVWNFKCSYDTDGLLKHLLVDVVHGEECLTRDYKYEYDDNHNIVTSHYVGYDCQSSGIQYKTENVFQQNLIRSQTKYVFSLHKRWSFADSTTYQYDESNRLALTEYYNASRVHTKTVQNDYDDHERIVTTIQLKDDGVWEPVKRVTQIYSDSDDVLSSQTESFHDGYFVNSDKVTYSYDGQNHCTSVLTQKWENETWENVKCVENSYDEQGCLIVAKLMKWQEGAFVDANRAVYELNEVGYPAVVSFEKWNGDEWVEGTWVSDFSVYSEGYLNRQNKELCNRDVIRIEIHYANTPMPDYDVDEYSIEQGFCTVYPNPTNGMVTITGLNLRQAEVVNTLGQRVAIVHGEGNQLSINISNLPAGIYFVNITDEEGRKCVRKVVKE